METIVDNPLYKIWYEASGGLNWNDWDSPFTVGAFHRSYDARNKCTATYAWAIPNDEAIKTLVEYSPVVEVGAGTGYWASLAAAAGCDILCFDINPPGQGNIYRHETMFHPVQQGGAKISAQYPDRTLFLCWPPYARAMAFVALRNYTGKRFIFVGESDGGCTGNDEFFELLAKDWQEIKTIDIPQWCGIHDAMWVYERKV